MDCEEWPGRTFWKGKKVDCIIEVSRLDFKLPDGTIASIALWPTRGSPLPADEDGTKNSAVVIKTH